MIAKSRGKVRELRLENSSGKLIDSEDPAHFIHAAKMTYEYRGDDLDKVVLEDKNRRKTLVLNYKNNNTVDLDGEYSEEQNGQTLILLSARASRSTAAGNETEETASKSNVIRYYFVYDDDGYTQELRYASDSWNNVGFDADGISGIRFLHDDLGRVDRTGYLTYTGQQEGSIEDDGAYQVMGNRDGIAGRSFSYQDYNLQDICCIDLDGKPVMRPDGYAGWKADFDKRGNEIRISYYGTDGNLVLNALGFAIIEADYDSGGNMTRKRFYGIDGELLDEVVFDEEEDGESA